MSANTAATQSQQPANVKLVMGAVMATFLLASLGQTIITTALPIIVSDLGGIEHISWAFTSYLLAATVAAPLFGKLGDMYGRKLIIQIGIGIFLAGSLLAALVPNLGLLVLCRFIQGLGGGGLIVTAMAAIGDVLPPRERGKAQGFIGAAFGVSTVIGPLIPGRDRRSTLTGNWLFLVNVLSAFLAFAIISAVFRARHAAPSARSDYVRASANF